MLKGSTIPESSTSVASCVSRAPSPHSKMLAPLSCHCPQRRTTGGTTKKYDSKENSRAKENQKQTRNSMMTPIKSTGRSRSHSEVKTEISRTHPDKDESKCETSSTWILGTCSEIRENVRFVPPCHSINHRKTKRNISQRRHQRMDLAIRRLPGFTVTTILRTCRRDSLMRFD